MNIYDYYITPQEYESAASMPIEAENLNRRIRLLGWKKQKALTTPLRKLNNRRKWADIALENGIGYNTFMNRVNNHGYSEKRAATEHLQDRKAAAALATEKIRKIPRKLIELAESNGIAHTTLHARLKKGWDLNTAATRPLLTRSEIGRIGANNLQALQGDINLVYRNSPNIKQARKRVMLLPDKYHQVRTEL